MATETLFRGKAFHFEKEGRLGILSFDLQGERVNKIGFEVAQELSQALDILGQRSSEFGALFIRSLKKQSFIVGADIKLIQSLKDESQAREASQNGQALFNRIEDLKIPTVVAIEGPCAGGGLELSLACRYRLASDFEKTGLSVPEVKLGILPGWGGTYRLPKVVGLTAALDMILTGKNIRGEKALKMGLVDALLPSALFAEKSLEMARQLAEGKSLPRAARKVALPEKLLASNFLGRKIVFAQAHKTVMKQTRGHYPAPLKILSVIEKGFGGSRAEALKREAQAFGELWSTSESKNLVNLFFLMEDSKKLTGSSLSEAEAKKLPPVKELGVLGAGVMGGGIAAQSAVFGIRTVVKDLNFEAVGKALAHARELFDGDVRKKRIKPAERDRRMALIRGQLDFTGFAALDLVIEAVVENMGVKQKVFAELEGQVGPQTLLSSNTSSLRLTEMGTALKDPARFVGIHFFNPVHKMPLVEIISQPQSSPEAITRAVNYARAIGKTPVVVKDGPGFLVNRLLLPWLNEAGYLLLEGYRIETLDRVAKNFGMPMGPCELLDEVGLDVAAKVGHILHESFGERARPAATLDKIVPKPGTPAPLRLGRKSGLGLYRWDKPAGKRQEPDTAALNALLFNGQPPKEPEYTDAALVRRMFYPMINEAARALEEGIVSSASQLDLAMIFGTGFPPFLGGLCRWADSVGLKRIVDELERLSELQGERFQPSEALKKFASGPGRFHAQ